MNNKTPLFLAIAAVLTGNLLGCSSNNGSTSDPTASATDPITGLITNDTSTINPQSDPDTTGSVDESNNDVALISQSNYETIFKEAFAVFTGAAFGSDVLALPLYPGLRALSSGGEFNDGSTERTDTCDNGGSAVLALDWSGSRVVTNDRRGVFDNCQSGSLLLDGEIQILESDNVSVASSGLTVEGDSMTQSFSGGVSYGDGNNYGGSSERWWGVSDLNWSVSSGDQVDFAISNANASYRIDGGYGQNMSGGFMLTTDGYTVQVQTDEPLVADRPDYTDPNYGPNNWYFKSGSLRITASDGSSALIEADSGDDAAARVTLANDGESESFDKLWSDWDSVLRAGPSPVR